MVTLALRMERVKPHGSDTHLPCHFDAARPGKFTAAHTHLPRTIRLSGPGKCFPGTFPLRTSGATGIFAPGAFFFTTHTGKCTFGRLEEAG